MFGREDVEIELKGMVLPLLWARRHRGRAQRDGSTFTGRGDAEVELKGRVSAFTVGEKMQR